jgi:hypothetical protein
VSDRTDKIRRLATHGATPGERAAARAALERLGEPLEKPLAAPAPGVHVHAAFHHYYDFVDLTTVAAAQAQAAAQQNIFIQGGHVFVNGQRVTPASEVNSISDLFAQAFGGTAKR